jgi:hypothetical protein
MRLNLYLINNCSETGITLTKNLHGNCIHECHRVALVGFQTKYLTPYVTNNNKFSMNTDTEALMAEITPRQQSIKNFCQSYCA